MFKLEDAPISLFNDLLQSDRELLAPLFNLICPRQGAVIFEQERSAEFLFVLLEGEVVVNFKPYDGPLLTIAHIHSGGVFGWSAILGRQVYTSNAVAVQDSSILRIRGDELRILCMRKPETGLAILERLAGAIAERLNSTHAQIFTMLTESMDLRINASRRTCNE
jgi:CRP/FNR family transcriptional regulator, cyclic AMP receptor protein